MIEPRFTELFSNSHEIFVVLWERQARPVQATSVTSQNVCARLLQIFALISCLYMM